jgi:hypothetical protein
LLACSFACLLVCLLARNLIFCFMQLSRLSHDADAVLAQCAILGLGFVSAGSNNSRVRSLIIASSHLNIISSRYPQDCLIVLLLFVCCLIVSLSYCLIVLGGWIAETTG